MSHTDLASVNFGQYVLNRVMLEHVVETMIMHKCARTVHSLHANDLNHHTVDSSGGHFKVHRDLRVHTKGKIPNFTGEGSVSDLDLRATYSVNRNAHLHWNQSGLISLAIQLKDMTL